MLWVRVQKCYCQNRLFLLYMSGASDSKAQWPGLTPQVRSGVTWWMFTRVGGGFCCLSAGTSHVHCCCCSIIQSCLTLCDPLDCSTPGLPVPHHLLKFAQVHVHCICDAIQPSHPLSPSSPSAFNFSQHQGLFQWVTHLHQRTKILELQLSISPSNEYSGLIYLDWFDPLAVQGTSRNLLQHHGLKASILWCSAFFRVQLSQPYVTTGKTVALPVLTYKHLKWPLCMADQALVCIVTGFQEEKSQENKEEVLSPLQVV